MAHFVLIPRATPLSCRLLGHRHHFRADGSVLRWSCRRCGAPGGSRACSTPAEAQLQARRGNGRERAAPGRADAARRWRRLAARRVSR